MSCGNKIGVCSFKLMVWCRIRTLQCCIQDAIAKPIAINRQTRAGMQNTREASGVALSLRGDAVLVEKTRRWRGETILLRERFMSYQAPRHCSHCVRVANDCDCELLTDTAIKCSQKKLNRPPVPHDNLESRRIHHCSRPDISIDSIVK